ncbi:MAG TPA: hemerythrin domain-containing protein [Methylotenera sp.]|nr:hemerythrin domain-containing protein [Methylotenera sp.]
MQTVKATTTRSTTRKTTAASASKDNAITLLKDDHAKVKKMFKEFEKLSKKDDDSKVEIANQICMELTIHAQVEEEIFYPAARMAIDDEDMLNEAEVEHDTAKDLIAQIQTMDPEDEMYDAKVTVLGEYINHHVEEEESEMFPKARKAKMDLNELGMQMKMKKEELMAELSPDGEINMDLLKRCAVEAANKH